MTRITNIMRWLRPAHPPGAPADFLLSSQQMWAMLERERMRADRGGPGFSLVEFHAPPTKADPLLCTLEARLRKTDLAGHLRNHSLGVFLPDTPHLGARKVVDDVFALLPKASPRPEFDIYVYPEPIAPEAAPDDHAAPDLHVGNGRAAQSVTDMLLKAPNGNGRSRPHNHSHDPSALRSQSLRATFVRPLPWWKRGVDIAGALAGLALLSPVLVIAGAAVKLTSPGPMLFQQQRAGLGGRPFTLWKFRTMCDRADAQQGEILHLNEQDGPAFKIKNDPRITPLGKLLRSSSIDELPQLWNVLRGEMSLVGPRPLPLHEADACERWQQRRLDVTPGLTCIWQVRGRSSVTFDQWMRMDLQYVGRRSLWQDLKLIFATIPAVLTRRGAS